MLRLAKQTPVRVVPWPNGERGGSLPGENDHVEAGELCDSLGTGCGGLVMVPRWLKMSPFKSFILNPADDCVHKYAIFTCTNLDHPFGSICLSGVTFFARSTPYSCLDTSRCHLMESFWWEPWGSSVGSCPNPPETQQPDAIDIDMISPLSCFCQMKFEEKSVDLQMF